MRLTSWLHISYVELSFVAVFLSLHSRLVNGITYVERKRDTFTQGKPDLFGFNYTFGECLKKYNANLRLNGLCQCKDGESTYLHFKNACIQNENIEDYFSDAKVCPDGPVGFKYQSDHGPIPVFDLTTASSSSSDDVYLKKGKTVSGQCIVSKLQYLEDSSGILCDETTNFANVFSLKQIRQKAVYLHWRPISESSILNGRVIVIAFANCTIQFWESRDGESTNPCIIFKAQGTITLSAIDISPTPTTVVPSGSTKPPPHSASYPSYVLTGSHPKTTTTTTTTTPSTSLNVPASSQTSTLQSTSTVLLGILPVKPTSSSNPTSSKRAETLKNTSSHTGAIVGSVIAVLAVVLVVVFVVLICRRRKQKNWRRETATQICTNNPTYGRRNTTETIELPQARNTEKKEDEFEYDYAAMDGDPRSPGYLKSNHSKGNGVYQSLMPDSQQASVYTPLNRENVTVSDQPSEYNKIERLLFKPARPTDPLYNVLQRPDDSNDDYLEPGVQICAKEPTSNRDLPFNEPVYNVLESPNDDNDSAPERDMGHMGHYRLDSDGYESTFEMMPVLRTKDDPTYEAPCGPLSESTYQPLDIKSPDDGMYQPLDQASRVIEH